MDANQTPFLLLALVGGYFFVRTFEPTRFEVAREAGHRLYFRSAYVGALLFLPAFLLTKGIHSATNGVWMNLDGIRDWLHALTGDELNVATASFLAMLVGKPIALLFNKFADEATYHQKALDNNDFERLVVTSMEQESAMMISLEDGKVYAGWAVNNPNLERVVSGGDRRFFTILPIMSGYRDDEQRVHWTIDYVDAFLETDEDKDLNHLDPDQFVVTVPMSRVMSARHFDLEANCFFHKSTYTQRHPS